MLVTLIEAYENQHYAFGPADPVEAIKFRMEQQGLTARDLEAYIGPSSGPWGTGGHLLPTQRHGPRQGTGVTAPSQR